MKNCDNKKSSPVIKIVLICIISVLCLAFIVFVVFGINWSNIEEWPYTKTTSIEDYGNYTGTAKDSYVQAFIQSYFPEKIDSSFSNVTYSYCAEGADTYGFEIYLEFTIADKAKFDRYVVELSKLGEWGEFAFDPSFMECEIRDGFRLVSIEPGEERTDRNISIASVKKVLYCEQTQTIIYWGLGVYDGGYGDTEHFCAFFDRFNIDPQEYEDQAYFPREISEP